MPTTPVPQNVSESVDRYVDSELAEARQYTNRTPLDDSGVWSLHELVAKAYAQGWSDGRSVADERSRRRHQRERDAEDAAGVDA